MSTNKFRMLVLFALAYIVRKLGGSKEAPTLMSQLEDAVHELNKEE
jgi:hypothetical protein